MESPRDKRPVSEQLERFFKDTEKNVEEAMRVALQKVRVPRHAEIQALNTRLDELAKRIEALTK